MKYLILLIGAMMVLSACQSTPTGEVTNSMPIQDSSMEKSSIDSMQKISGQDQPSDSIDMIESEPTQVFVLTGENFAFFINGVEAPDIRVKQGNLVRIEFTSTNGFHDWVIDEFNAKTEQVRPENGMTAVEFVADKTGTFEYYCSVGQHRANGMRGNLIVE